MKLLLEPEKGKWDILYQYFWEATSRDGKNFFAVILKFFFYISSISFFLLHYFGFAQFEVHWKHSCSVLEQDTWLAAIAWQQPPSGVQMGERDVFAALEWC